MSNEPLQRYILLPGRSLTGSSSLVSTHARDFLSRAQASASSSNGIHVVDSIAENGAKLLDLTPRALQELKTHQPGLQLVREQLYTPALQPRVECSAAATRSTVRLQVLDAQTRAPVPHAHVVALVHGQTGSQATTNLSGEAWLHLEPATQLERLYVYPRAHHWPLLRTNLTLEDTVALTPIDPAYPDALRFFYPTPTGGQGVRVGILDTGIAAHPDLKIAGGYNAVPFEDANDWGDNGEGHGTHVAGILAACTRGLAPQVELRSYRIFARGSGAATSWAIAKAIHQATKDGCDLLNLSLGGGPHDPTVQTAIRDAREAGCVLFCAAGNDHRAPVSFPASDPLVVAISAIGREGTVPEDAESRRNIDPTPSGNDPRNYVAAFSNVGPELSLTAPGDGIVSTYPGGYAVFTGTSMACPAATARAACLLSADPTLRDSPRKVDRADALVTKVLLAARPLGFGPDYEGSGLLP